MDNFAIQRTNMVESQVRPSDVTDRRIIDSMLKLPRENFVPASLRGLAYMDQEVQVKEAWGNDLARALLRPMVLAKLVQLAHVGEGDLVLDVGCATGYSTALLASLAGAVVGLDCDEPLIKNAGKDLAEIGADNAVVVLGPLEEGCSEEGPYDVIFLNGYVPEPPVSLRAQLKPGGRLVGVIAETGFGRAMLFERVGDGWSSYTAFNANAPWLPGFARKKEFVF